MHLEDEASLFLSMVIVSLGYKLNFFLFFPPKAGFSVCKEEDALFSLTGPLQLSRINFMFNVRGRPQKISLLTT